MSDHQPTQLRQRLTYFAKLLGDTKQSAFTFFEGRNDVLRRVLVSLDPLDALLS